MSWNARRFAIAAHNNPATRGARLLWLSPEALDRIESALGNGTLRWDEDSVPVFPEDTGLIVGLPRPMHTAVGDVWGLHVESEAQRAAFILELSGASTGEMSALDRVGIETWYNHVRLFHHLNQRAEATTATALVATGELDAEPLGTPRIGNMAQVEVLEFVSDRLPFQGATTPAERLHLVELLSAAWILLHEPIEREVSATTLSTAPIRTGKGRRARDVSVSVIDVRRATATRSAPSGRIIEHDHRWERIGHWAWRACGKGKTERRRVWIDPTICGPVDKPLLRRPKVSVLR